MSALKDILNLTSGVILVTGDGKKISRVYLRAWEEDGRKILAEALPFSVEGDVYIGSPFESDDFDVYLIINPLSRPKAEREQLNKWLAGHRDKLVLLYERKYVKDSITRYGISEFIDYLIAYRRETVGFERVDVLRLKNGRIVDRKTYIKRS
ncbi:MAG: hypothetical protein PWQ79_1231 [Thermococcaceae archaeon]|nr:hypothetical protein [Thermococcaceae archaeon]MDK2914316.1 hypothetical protein [Thermococcaceae archaeon]